MKVLFSLLALYILVLAGIPCQADDDCCTATIAAGSASSQPANTRRQADHPSPCSPFFACGCCHGFVVPQALVCLPKSQPVQQLQQAFYRPQPLPDFYAPIWQPPKTARS
ncbi:hypothetical protein [Puia dinghuensis]|uniref:hypothetical protein n=1 Tax=Puia dinghuensis TaxID=1792502 RepID=UPI00166C19CF|nr:hypothetical protein [Puia dinghuensis]